MTDKYKMSAKEAAEWDDWQKAVKPGARRGGVVMLWLALAALVMSAALAWVTVKPAGQGGNVVYIVATPTPGVTHYIRFICYHNSGRMLSNMGVTWQRENGQTVDDVTDALGCIIVPADEIIGIWNHVTQAATAVWPGARPVCLDIASGRVESGNLCPPGQMN